MNCFLKKLGVKKIEELLINSKYANKWIVLICDSLISSLSTLIVYLVLAFFNKSILLPSAFMQIAVISFILSFIIFYLFNIHRGIIRHTTFYEILKLFFAIIVKVLAICIVLYFLKKEIGIYLSFRSIVILEFCDALFSLTTLITIRLFVISLYRLFMNSNAHKTKRVVIYDIDSKSVALYTYLSQHLNAEFKVMGFIKRDKNVKDFILMGLNVYSLDNYDKLLKSLKEKNINSIAFSSQQEALHEKDRLVKFCLKNKIKVYILPQLNEVYKTKDIASQLREIKIEDLLGREEINIDMQDISNFLLDKKIMVTGGAGSIGSELVRLIRKFPITELIILDSAETPMHNIQLEVKDIEHNMLKENFIEDEFNKKYKFIIADVRKQNCLEKIFERHNPDIIFHAAAYKHVPLMEENPCEAIITNVLGTKNIADLAVKYNVEKVVMISTDKAVNPTNVMGCSKRLAEIYVQSLSQAIKSGDIKGKTKFITTRFGNVLGSNGSVIPRFREQIKLGGPVTVTHPDIIRYFMTIPEACRLVLEAATMGDGDEIFVFDMGRPVKIADLARNMIYLSGLVPDKDIQIEYTGLRPGEKLYEELLNDKEATIPTSNDKIFVAKVRQYNFKDIENLYHKFVETTNILDNIASVKLMKDIVPEFVSKNSEYHNLDK